VEQQKEEHFRVARGVRLCDLQKMRLWLIMTSFSLAIAATSAEPVSPPEVQMLVPGFTVEEVPVKLSNQNNLRFAPDGTLTSLGYDGRIWRLRDTNGDGLEDRAEPFWSQPTLSVPLGMAWSTRGLYVSSKGKVSRIIDTDGDGQGDVEEIIASGWPPTDVGSGGVDATSVTLDSEGNVFFGLLVADYSNAYRLRKRKDLKLEEIAWLKSRGRWHGETPSDSPEDQFSLYDLDSPRGTIQKWDARTKRLLTVATGIRVPVALAFNRAGDLFNTDQEGETWMPNGNPLDELNHIVAGRNYGFPPSHERWLPDISSEPPVVAFGPQHQSSCGLVFNEPHPSMNAAGEANPPLPAGPAQGLFGPAEWEGDAFVTGESRGRVWRTHLIKTPTGYVGTAQTIARISMLVIDATISPRGELYVCCHSGFPDWGTGPQGPGKIFRIKYTDSTAPVPLGVSPAGLTELRVLFDKPLHQDVPRAVLAPSAGAKIEFGEYVSAGDRFEKLKPPYAVVLQQDATPRGHLRIESARLDAGNRTLLLTTEPHPFLTRYSITLPGIKGTAQNGSGATVDLDYDLTQSSQLPPKDSRLIARHTWREPLAWAPKTRPSGGTDSRAPQKPDGDWEHGHELFLSAQMQCSKCHRIRGEGGTAGPDLSNLVHRDVVSVLRDIREPSATLHPDYVTYQVGLKDGDPIQGFIRSQQEDSIHLFDVDGKETVIQRSHIQSVRPTEVSLMPSGLLDSAKTNDVRDLLTFLLWEPPKHSIDSAQAALSSAAVTRAGHDGAAKTDLRIVLVASKQDHGPGQHDYPSWQTNWARLFVNAKETATVSTAWEWPSSAQFTSASVLVLYFWNHDWSAERLAQVDAFLARGGGLVLIHAAVIADKDPETLAQRIGLSAQPGRTGYRHTPFELRLLDRDHPITRGMPERLDLLDEPYWPLIGRPDDVHVLASAQVDGELRPLIWTREQGKGRIFASVLGHYTWTLNDPLFRIVLLRGIAWAAGQDNPIFGTLAAEQADRKGE
jgi:putative heme-binding domain-containing protein